MRLRQIALAARNLDSVTGDLEKVFGLQVAYNDPGIHHYGLKNAVLSAGSGFLEVVQPITETASAARFLARRGGDAGYMIILQAPDAEAERARVSGLGVRVVDDIDLPGYRAAHFHPADFGGVLVSIDQQRTTPDYLEPEGDWWPAGPDWRSTRAEGTIDLVAVTLSSADPAGLADRWGRLLGTPLDTDGALRLELARGELRFESGPPGATLIAAIDLKVADPAAMLERARASGLEVSEGAVAIGGVSFRPVA
jgi:hypothetical protein